MTKDSDQILFVERYNRLFEITHTIIKYLTPNDTEMFIPFVQAGGGPLDLGLNRVVALLPETATSHDRDHLILVHLTAMESHLYRHGYCPTGHMIRIFSGDYENATEEEKRSIIRDGFQCAVVGVSSAEDWAAITTPLRRVTDAEYSDLYERLIKTWGKPRQKEVAKMMETRLATIQELLPRQKIGNEFRRTRAGRTEPLPLYVRNELHHPTIDGLLESTAFQRDKSIGYAIMKAWLSEDE